MYMKIIKIIKYKYLLKYIYFFFRLYKSNKMLVLIVTVNRIRYADIVSFATEDEMNTRCQNYKRAFFKYSKNVMLKLGFNSNKLYLFVLIVNCWIQIVLHLYYPNDTTTRRRFPFPSEILFFFS